jgi:hypothetical protein
MPGLLTSKTKKISQAKKVWLIFFCFTLSEKLFSLNNPIRKLKFYFTKRGSIRDFVEYFDLTKESYNM